MILGDLIKEYRLHNGLSLRDFAQRCGLSHTYISALEKNIDSRTGKPIAPTLDTVKYISKGMGISIEDILKVLDDEQEFKINEDAPKCNLTTENKQVLPILGTVKAGYDYLAQENWTGYVNIDKKVSDPENYFALKITGDSMQPVLYEDDIVIVHRQNDIESGQIGIILVNNDEATVKRIVKHNDYIELKSFNSYYPPKKLDKNIKFTIIGKVTEARISKVFE